MKKLALAATLLLSTVPLLAEGHGPPLRAVLIGYQEVPAVATPAEGLFEARVARDGQSVDWTLSYTGLKGNVQQAHIHFAQRSVNGHIVVWLCGTPHPPGQTTGGFPGPAGTQTCPQSGTISGTFASANVIGSLPAPASGQQLATGDLATFIDAMQSGIAYANVHTTGSPGGEIRGQLGGRGWGHGH